MPTMRLTEFHRRNALDGLPVRSAAHAKSFLSAILPTTTRDDTISAIVQVCDLLAANMISDSDLIAAANDIGALESA